MSRHHRLIMTLTVLLVGAFSVGHYVGASNSASAVSECRAAVIAALDDYRSAEGAFDRFVEHSKRCV